MRSFQHHHGHRHGGEESHRHHFGRRGFGQPGHGWDGDAGDRSSGRGRRRVFDSGELRLVLLKLIADEPRHGYELIRAIVRYAEVGKKSGIDAIAGELRTSPHPFLTDACQMMLDGVDSHILRERMENDINTTRLRHQQQTNIFNSAGTFAPIFGLLGTLIGVVQVLRNIQDPSMMGSSMAIAMTASFYGIFSANFLFLPIASKLGYYSDEDILSREIIAKGVLSIYDGDVPWLVSKKLEGYLSLALRRKAKTGK
jgi:chemotaxis protein MotA